MTVLERAARAAQDAMTKGSGGEPYRDIARAVLLAVRDEAVALKWVGHRAIWDQGSMNAEELSVAAFTAMIDAILSEPQP